VHVEKPPQGNAPESKEHRRSPPHGVRQSRPDPRFSAPQHEPVPERHRNPEENHRLHDNGPHHGHGVVAVARNLVEAMLHDDGRAGEIGSRDHCRGGSGRHEAREIDSSRRIRRHASRRPLHRASLHRECAISQHVHRCVFAARKALFIVRGHRDEHVHVAAPKGIKPLGSICHHELHVRSGRGIKRSDVRPRGSGATEVHDARRNVLHLLAAVGPAVKQKVERHRSAEDCHRVARQKGVPRREAEDGPEPRGRCRRSRLWRPLRCPLSQAPGKKRQPRRPHHERESRKIQQMPCEHVRRSVEHPHRGLQLQVVGQRKKDA